MKIRMVQSYRVYRRGQVLPDVPDGMANDWIKRGLAVEETQQDIETAALEPVVERADATLKRKRKP
jgi:hypothetical protein